MDKNFLTPPEIAASVVSVAMTKTKMPALRQFVLGILAGAFIAFAAEGSTMGAFNLLAKADTFGLGRALAGVIFPTGLMLVLVAGGELFTGNNLILVGVLERKVRLYAMFKNWFFVYLGNLVGSLIIAYMMTQSGLFGSGANLLGAVTIKTAVYKVNLGFMPALYLGILCNWLVCLAVWMAYGAKDITGKLLSAFFPISLFITSGFEHSVANMYYIPAGILAKANPEWVKKALEIGVPLEKIAHLDWGTFVWNNLLPVTLGNMISGCIFVAGVYWYTYMCYNQNSVDNGKTCK